jgi:hypothetical protein
MSEPIVWINKQEIKYLLATKQNGGTDWKTNLGLVPEEGDVPLYLKKEWVGLTDDEISELIRASHNTGSFVRVIEAKLKEKNT